MFDLNQQPGNSSFDKRFLYKDKTSLKIRFSGFLKLKTGVGRSDREVPAVQSEGSGGVSGTDSMPLVAQAGVPHNELQYSPGGI